MSNKLNENEQIPVEEDIALLKNRPKSISSIPNLRVYVGIGVILTILGVGAFFAMQNKIDQAEQVVTPPVPVVNPASQAVLTSIASDTVAASAAVTPVITPNPAVTNPAPTPAAGGKDYYVKIGVYDKATAELKAQQLKQRNYDIRMITVSKGTQKVSTPQYRVSITYTDKADAKSDLPVLTAKGYKNAQIVESKGEIYIRINTYDSKAKANSIQSTLAKLGYNADVYTVPGSTTQNVERVEVRAVGYTKDEGYEVLAKFKKAGYQNPLLIEAREK